MESALQKLDELKGDRSNVIKALQLIQLHEGFISDTSIREIADAFYMPAVEVEGIVSFYAQFKRNKPGTYMISVCDGTACHIKGSPQVLHWISDELGIGDEETSEDGLFSIERVACLGCCSLAPVIKINDEVYGQLNRKKTMKILKQYQKESKND